MLCKERRSYCMDGSIDVTAYGSYPYKGNNNKKKC
jgi:hypothetical protein